MIDFRHDPRIVMTLDAGGTNFRFSAVQGGRRVVETVAMPSHGHDLDRCLANLVDGFRQVRNRCPHPPAALSFAFPGPADYPNGIIGDLNNLPAFRGGVALGPMLAERFGVPVFINNDGDLFAYGEAIAGLLPHVNGLLERAGNPKRYRNLFGVTLGTGFGGGLVSDGRLFRGDNSGAAEVWLLRNKLVPAMRAEEGASIRAVRRAYAEAAGIPSDQAPDPKTIHEIGTGNAPGDQAAAIRAFRQLGEVVGDALGNALTLVDGLAVIGGGVSGAWPLFLPSIMAELNGEYSGPDGTRCRRLSATAFNLEDPEDLERFLKDGGRGIRVPGSCRIVRYDPLVRVGVGISRLGTSEAVNVGAYVFALRELDQGQVHSQPVP